MSLSLIREFNPCLYQSRVTSVQVVQSNYTVGPQYPTEPLHMPPEAAMYPQQVMYGSGGQNHPYGVVHTATSAPASNYEARPNVCSTYCVSNNKRVMVKMAFFTMSRIAIYHINYKCGPARISAHFFYFFRNQTPPWECQK